MQVWLWRWRAWHLLGRRRLPDEIRLTEVDMTSDEAMKRRSMAQRDEAEWEAESQDAWIGAVVRRASSAVATTAQPKPNRISCRERQQSIQATAAV